MGFFGGGGSGERGSSASHSEAGATGSGEKGSSVSHSEAGATGSSESGRGEATASVGSETGSTGGEGLKSAAMDAKQDVVQEKTEGNSENTELGKLSNGEFPRNGERLEEMTKENLEKENKRIEAEFQDYTQQRWGENPEELELKQKLIDQMLEESKEHYDNASRIAEKDAGIYRFSDHTQDRHVRQVVKGTLEQADQNAKLAEKCPEKWGNTFSTSYSENTLIFSAINHDVGMAGRVCDCEDAVEAYQERCEAHDPTASKTVGEEIRKEHSRESAMYILSQREAVEKMNRQIAENTPEGEMVDRINVDEAAMLAAMHSKSADMGNGSVKDLTDHAQILAYAKGLKQTAQERGLEFNDDFLYKTNEKGEVVPDEDAIRRVATECAALRLGDAFRPSSDVQMTQSGKAVFVDVSDVDPGAKSLQEEMDGARVGFFEADGSENASMRLDKHEAMTVEQLQKLTPAEKKAMDEQHGKETTNKAYAVGEKNIRDITPGEVDESGEMYSDFYLRDGNLCPHATAYVIGERVGESNSIGVQQRGDVVYRIHSEVPMTEEGKKRLGAAMTKEIVTMNNREKELAKHTAPTELTDEGEDGTILTESVPDPGPSVRFVFVDD